MTDQDLDRALAALKADNGEHLGSVSGRVMAQVEVEVRRKRRAAALWISLAAAAALVAVVLSIPREGATLSITVAAPGPPVMALNVVQRTAPFGRGSVVARHPISRPRTTTTTAAAPAESLEVRMQTDDPDVVIIWLVDSEAAQQETGKKGTL